MTVVYFAYGSNLCLARLKDRVPGARFRCLASLESHELRWHKRSNNDGSGKLTVVASNVAGSPVVGALFAIPADEKERLDRAEGLGFGYEEVRVTLATPDGQEEAVTYVASASHIDEGLRPFSWYRDLAVAGAESLGLPSGYIDHLRAAPADEDPDSARDARERSFIPCGE